jgi:hypothetical protein
LAIGTPASANNPKPSEKKYLNPRCAPRFSNLNPALDKDPF